MIKRILAGAAAAAFAATLLTAGSASAACTGSEPAVVAADKVPGTPTPNGTTVYGKQAGQGGYIHVTGSTGWIKAEGQAGGTGTIQGSGGGGAVNGKIVTNGASKPTVCVNDKTA